MEDEDLVGDPLSGGDNSQSVAGELLRAFIRRIESLEDDKASIVEDIKEVYGETKSAGFDTKAIRKLVTERRKGRDEEFETVLDLYRAALGMI